MAFPGVAGANIANSAGRPNKDTPYAAWTAAVIQFPIGNYVEAPDEVRLAADTNYIGYNNNAKWQTNVIGQGSIAVGPTIAPQPDFTSPDNDNDVRGGISQWVRAAGTIAAAGTCTVTAGAATAGAGTFICNVVGGVVAGDFFWASVAAET